ncbi:PAS domain-containing protein, partial [Campylobacter jejuni]|uniref:PAS domain-containing protein n=1 Tax=Campylobacter jejuni TaxID=197 RepID=UPI001F095BB6
IDHIPTQITVKEAASSRYVLINTVAIEQFGTTAADIIGKTPRDLFPPHVADGIIKHDEMALEARDTIFIDDHPWN